tara:strand:- start:80662 stop:80844 length:183 start_codon:yes stop_codon:yes gene_type:complete
MVKSHETLLQESRESEIRTAANNSLLKKDEYRTRLSRSKEAWFYVRFFVVQWRGSIPFMM